MSLTTKKIAINYIFKSFCNLNDNEIGVIWRWRNHESIRKWMYDKNPIDFENHLKFIESLKVSNSKKYWLVIRNNQAIGVFSIVNILNKNGEWGYYIAPEFHEMNLSVEFYYYTLNFLFENACMDVLFGYAKEENKAANSLNSLFGFTKEIVNKEVDGKFENYFFLRLTSKIWSDEIKWNTKILKLLKLTQKNFNI